MENANANIITMLKLIFPTSYPIKNNINTSYKKYLLKQGPAITFDVGDVKTMFSSGEITALGKHNYSYLKLNSGIFTVSEIIWLNEVLNNKTYRELIERLIEYNEWYKKQSSVINEDIEKITDQLQNGLTEKGKGSGTGDLIIDKSLRDDLVSQKRIYNPDDIKQDIIKIIKKHLIPDETKVGRFDEELSNMIDYFIDTNIKKTKETPITQFVRFKDIFDFTYKVQGEPINFFALHKKYDGKDRAAEREKLNEENEPKQKERDKLINGYTFTKILTNKFVFGTVVLEKYKTQLLKAIEYLQGVTFASPNRISIQDNKKHGEEITKFLENVFNNNPDDPNSKPEYPDGVTVFVITKDKEYNLREYDTLKGTLGQEKAVKELTERYENADEYSKVLNEQKTKLDAEIKAIDDRFAKLGEAPEEVFAFSKELDGSGNLITTAAKTISDLKNDNRAEITQMQQEIFKYVITRYNRYQETKGSAEVSSQYSDIDGAIDTIVDEIEKLNSLAESSIINAGKSTITADQILNITEPIKNSFDKLNTGNKIAISRKIGEKLTQIVKLSNQIKFLSQFQAVFFKEPATGIFVEYEKKLYPNDSFTKPAINELKQEKYSNFKKIVDFINDKFVKNNVVSLNSKLAKLLKEYIENQNNGFYDQVVEPANKLLNLGENPNVKDLEPLWNVSVTSLKSETSGTEYGIYVYMDVIEGEVNASNQSEIKCQFLDEELTRRFEELTDEVPSFGPSTNTKIFSVKKAKEEKIKHEQDKKDELNSVLSLRAKRKNESLPVAVPVSTGGKIYTKSLRRKSNKKNRTKKMAVFTENNTY
jgi:hypothetical protein